MATSYASLRKYLFEVNAITKFSHQELGVDLPNVHLEITQYFIHFLLTNKKNNSGFWPETWEKIDSIVKDSFCPTVDAVKSYFSEKRLLILRYRGQTQVDEYQAEVEKLIAYKVRIAAGHIRLDELKQIGQDIITFYEVVKMCFEQARIEEQRMGAKLWPKVRTVLTFRLGKRITSTDRLRSLTPFLIGVTFGVVSYFSPWNDLVSTDGSYRLYQAIVVALLVGGITLFISRRNFYRRMIAALLFPLTFPILNKALIVFNSSDTGKFESFLISIQNEASTVSTASIYLIVLFTFADLISPYIGRR